jgi:integrase
MAAVHVNQQKEKTMASIKKINSRKFKITVSNGYRPNGQKVSKAKTITVPDTVGNRGINQYVAHEAEEFERTVKSGYCEDGEMTFEEYALRWLDRQTKYAPSTIGSYRRMLTQVYPFIGAIKLNRLRPIALENMMVQLRKRTFHGKPIQEATAQKYLTVVSAVLSDAKRNEIIQKNPARMIDLPETEHRMQEIPSDEEAKRFLDLICNIPYVYTVYYALAIYTGCRRGELCALKWDDFIMNERRDQMEPYTCILTVSHSRSFVPGKGIQEGTTKNGKSRAIFLGDEMTGIVQHLCVQKTEEAKEGGFEMSDYLFTNEYGELIHPDTFTKFLRRLCDENGFPKSFHLHTLRHYFVSTMLHNGVDKQTVAELAGHGDTSFLERTYCHPQMALKRQASERMTDTLFHDGSMSTSQKSAAG